MQTKQFAIEDVLSSIYGTLLCPIGNVYEFLNFLFDDNFFTHQLPKAGRQAMPIVEEQHPFLKEINLEGINTDNWQERLNQIKASYPNEIIIKQVRGYSGGMFQDLAEAINKKTKAHNED